MSIGPELRAFIHSAGHSFRTRSSLAGRRSDANVVAGRTAEPQPISATDTGVTRIAMGVAPAALRQ